MKTISCDGRRSVCTCPICSHERGSVHCKHFVAFNRPDSVTGNFDGLICTQPDFRGMPVSDRLYCTTIEDDSFADSYWMDYETGIDPMTEGFKKLTREQAKNNDAGLVDLLKPKTQGILIEQHERDFIERVCDAVNVYKFEDSQLAETDPDFEVQS